MPATRWSLAGDAAQAQLEVDAVLPDLVVLDWMLPDQSGLALARRWRNDARTRGLPIIMLTARAEETDKIAGPRLGCRRLPDQAVLHQRAACAHPRRAAPAAPEALEQAVRAGESAGRPGDAPRHGWRARRAHGPHRVPLLHFLMTHPERVHSRKQLLDRVWGDHVFIEERTVDVHVKRLRDALSPVQCATMIETVRGVGYRFARQASSRGRLRPPREAGWRCSAGSDDLVVAPSADRVGRGRGGGADRPSGGHAVAAADHRLGDRRRAARFRAGGVLATRCGRAT